MIRLNTGVTLAYFKKDRNSLFTADDHYDLAFIRNYLAFKDVNLTQYIETSLKLFHDLLDDLVRLKNSVFIFYIDEKNDEITQMVTQKLKEIDSQFIVIWAGFTLMNKVEFNSKEAIPDKVITENITENILASLNEYDIQFNGESACMKGLSHYQASPYKNENIPPILANQYGVRLNLSDLTKSLETDFTNIANQLSEEFRSFQTYGVVGTIPFLDDDILKHLDLFHIFMDMIEYEHYSYTFSGKVSLQNFSVEILNKLINNHFTLLEIVIYELNEEAILKINEIENIIISDKLNIVYSINLLRNDESVKWVTLNSFLYRVKNIGLFQKRVKLTSIIDAWREFNPDGEIKYEYPIFINDDLQHYKTKVLPERALINGYASCLTGYYPYNFKGGNSKHIIVESQRLAPEVYRDLGQFLGINSALINQSKQYKELQQENSLLYSKNDDFIREKDEVFDYNKKSAKQKGTFLPHYHQVYQTEETYVEKLQIDDHHSASQIEILKAPYSHGQALKLLNDNNFLSIQRKEDLDHFLTNVNSFIKTGRFHHNYEISTVLMDGCRWGGKEHCTLTKLHRFQIDDKQHIFPCGGSSKAIGSCSDSYISVVGKALQISEEEETIRGCSTCPVRNTCSKCAILPDFLDREQYCEVRRGQPYIDEYINISNMIRTLVTNIPTFKESSIDSLKVTTSCKTHLFSDGGNHRDHGENSIIHDHLYLVFLRETPFIVDSRSFKLLQINGTVALIFEGLLKATFSERIKEELMSKLQVSMKQADNLFRRTIDKLLELNYLDYKRTPELL